MTDPKKLTADDARALLSDHIEGGLDDATRAEVDALLATDAGLAAERRRLEKTMSLLRALPAPEAPSDVVAKVRARLAEERREERRGGSAEMAPASIVGRPPSTTTRRWGGFEAAIGLAAAASIAVFIAVVGVGKGDGGAGPDGTHAAGLSGETRAVPTTVVAPGFPRYVVSDLAAQAGMDTVVGDTYEGDRRAAARFLMKLKETAAVRGVEISGFVPDAERVRIEVRSAP